MNVFASTLVEFYIGIAGIRMSIFYRVSNVHTN